MDPNSRSFEEDVFQYHQKAGVPQRFVILNPAGEAVFYLKQKFFALRIYVEVYEDPQYSRLAFVIRKRRLIELFPRFHVLDGQGNLLGSIRRKPAFFQHKWSILDPDGELIGEADQDPAAAALESVTLTANVRGFNVGGLVQNFSPFHIFYQGERIGTFYRILSMPFVEYEMDLRGDPQKRFDRRLALGLAVVLDRGENR